MKQPAPLVFSTAFGLLMAAAAAAPADGVALIAAALSGVAVLVGVWVRAVTTIAVLLTIAALAVSNPSAWFAALSGLSAVAYLLVRHAAGPPAVVTTTWPSLIGAVGFSVAVLAATILPVQLPWLPLAAPLAVVGTYLLAVRPYLTRHGAAAM